MQKPSHTRIVIGIAAVLVVCIGLFLVINGRDTSNDVSPPPNYAKMLAGSPAPLAALHEQGDELLGGGKEEFEKRMSELKGFPVVVNMWASWCGPCRAEFPHLQQASANFGKKVAFLGVNSSDDADAAATFLSTHQVPYPSFSDPDAEIKESLDAKNGFPATAIFDSEGKQTFTRMGQYPSLEELEADIQTYGIDGGN